MSASRQEFRLPQHRLLADFCRSALSEAVVPLEFAEFNGAELADARQRQIPTYSVEKLPTRVWRKNSSALESLRFP